MLRHRSARDVAIALPTHAQFGKGCDVCYNKDAAVMCEAPLLHVQACCCGVGCCLFVGRFVL